MSDKEIAIPSQAAGLVSVIERAALDPNVDIDKMERLLNMQERIIDKESQMAFNRGMSECQKKMPAVARDKVNQQTNSKYAKFETILTSIKPVYSEYGFSVSFGTDDSPIEGHIRVTADVLHSEGHNKHYFVDLPPDIAGIKGSVNKTAMHATGSTYSYGKRYLITMIFNIAVADEDDDANLAGGITIEQLLDYIATVRDLLSSIAAIKDGLCTQNYESAAESYNELTQEEANSLWRAPSKGGIFTTIERQQIKSSDFLQALKDIRSA